MPAHNNARALGAAGERRSMSTKRSGNSNSEIELYAVRGRIIMVQVWPKPDFYQIFVSLTETNDMGGGAPPDEYLARPRVEEPPRKG
jgi:hypothetical protein